MERDLPEPLHPLEAKCHESDPEIGSEPASRCLPGWIVKFCRAFEQGEGLNLSPAQVSAIGHTLIAARARNYRNAKAMGRPHEDKKVE